MEVKIGVRDIPRDIVLESDDSAESVANAVEAAISGGSLLRLKDDKGRTIVVPGNLIGYVEIGAEETRRVGFGTI
ncbi:DUF3107 domain-containing protein [Kineosporia mesophila]|uniref:DUF3107 domain-containing protein n=1 Tax=Kineosporia mesophila TaxID=566012 RepID=A0ABP6YVH4_9ACTN|nr:DUF3107 domain-containing protein [Kineosporia mesophila]